MLALGIGFTLGAVAVLIGSYGVVLWIVCNGGLRWGF